MKFAILFLLLSTTVFAEETFRLKDFGVSITTPDGWIHDEKDTFGYVLRATAAAKPTQKILVHHAFKEAKSVREAAELTLKRINEFRAPKQRELEVVLSSGPVTTRSGIKGWRSAHGFTTTSKVPYIVHYYFQPPRGHHLRLRLRHV